MGTLAALYWSFPSEYTSCVAIEYCRPDLGLDGAGEGGKSWPSRSTCANALPRAFSFGFGRTPVGGEEEELAPDIVAGGFAVLSASQGGGTSSTTWSFEIRTLRRI